jgi:aldehyde:ferredoxin oxidoreductase
MPRGKGIMGLIYALNPFGPDHVSTEHDQAIADGPGEILRGFGIYETAPDVWRLSFEKVKLLAYSQRFVSALDSFTVCQFCFNTWAMFNFVEFIDVVRAATGWDYTLNEFTLLGERRINMMRVFNQREGFSGKDDVLPPRLFEDPFEDTGPRSGAVYDKELFEESKRDYYILNGWDPETGNPTEQKLKELGLGWA